MNRIVLLALLAPLAACATGAPDQAAPSGAVLPTARYELKAEEVADRVNLAVHADGLSDPQRQALAQLRLEGLIGGVVLTARSEPRAAAHAEAVRRYLADLGLADVSVRADPSAAAGVVEVAFKAVRPVVPDCDRSWGDMTKTRTNQSHTNLGCAVNANLMAQIADPRDILRPKAETPPDSARRATVIERYRQGGATASEFSERDSAALVKTIK